MHESEQLRRLSPPAARAAPPASPRPFPQPDPSPQSPSSVTSLCRVLACKVAAAAFVAVPCQFHRNCLLGNSQVARTASTVFSFRLRSHLFQHHMSLARVREGSDL